MPRRCSVHGEKLPGDCCDRSHLCDNHGGPNCETYIISSSTSSSSSSFSKNMNIWWTYKIHIDKIQIHHVSDISKNKIIRSTKSNHRHREKRSHAPHAWSLPPQLLRLGAVQPSKGANDAWKALGTGWADVYWCFWDFMRFSGYPPQIIPNKGWDFSGRLHSSWKGRD